jgi:hypothetical protein
MPGPLPPSITIPARGRMFPVSMRLPIPQPACFTIAFSCATALPSSVARWRNDCKADCDAKEPRCNCSCCRASSRHR